MTLKLSNVKMLLLRRYFSQSLKLSTTSSVPVVQHSYQRKPKYDAHAYARLDESLKKPIFPFKSDKRVPSADDSKDAFYPHGTPLKEPVVLNSREPQPILPIVFTCADRRVGVLAEKRGVMSFWDEKYGRQMVVTVLQINDAVVVGKKHWRDRNLHQLSIGSGRIAIETEQQREHFQDHIRLCQSSGVGHVCEHLASFTVSENGMLPVGTPINAAHFLPGQLIDTKSTSKDKGFQGVMKRWHFGGQSASHGTSLAHRSGGSIGQRKDPGKVWKGKKMAGQMGDKAVTVARLRVVKVDSALNLLYIKGTIPGPNGAIVKVRDTIYSRDQFATIPTVGQVGPPPFPTYRNEQLQSELEWSGPATDPLAVRYNLLA